MARSNSANDPIICIIMRPASVVSVRFLTRTCTRNWQGRREFYDQVVADLNARGLLNSPNFLHSTMSAAGMVAKRTATLADAFTTFITDPLSSIGLGIAALNADAAHEVWSAARKEQ